MRFGVVIAVMLVSLAAEATSLRVWQPHDPVENPHFCSRDEQVCVVVRQYANVPDFGSVRADVVWDFSDGMTERAPRPAQPIGAVYAGGALVHAIQLPRDYEQIVVSDSGKFMALLSHATVTIRSIWTDETRVIALSDVLSSADEQAWKTGLFEISAASGTEEDRDVLILTLGGGATTQFGTIRVDFESGKRLGELTSFYPTPRVWIMAADAASQDLLDRAVSRPLPNYPSVAQKARIAGVVRVEVTVSKDSSVHCTTLKGLPFGITEAAEEAIRAWIFLPQQQTVRGVLELHFHLLNDEEFAALQNRVPDRSPF